MRQPILIAAFLTLAMSHAIAGPSSPANMEESTPAHGQTDTPEGADGPALDDTFKPHNQTALNGLLVDRTITMIGKTFFQQFSQRRLDSVLLSNVSLVINERPSARWGSIVWVAEGTQILYQVTLPPRLNDVDQYAKAATKQVEELILRRKVTQAFQQNPDMAGDEW